MRIAAVLYLLLAGSCGRLAFDPRSDADTDAGSEELAPREAEVDAFETGEPTYQPVPGGTLDLPASPGVRWVLMVSAALESTWISSPAVEARYTLDGVELGVGGSHSERPDRPGPWQHFALVEGRDDVQRVQVELRDLQGGTSRITQLHIVAMPLREDPQREAPVLYTAHDEILLIDSTTPTPALRFSLRTPLEAPTPYIVFMLFSGSAGGSSSPNDLVHRWGHPDPALASSLFLLPRETWQSLFLARRVELSSSTPDLELEATSVAGAAIRTARVLAIPAALFAERAIAGGRDERVNASATPLETASLAGSQLEVCARRCVVLANMVLEPTCPGGVYPDRKAWFTRGDELLSIHHAPESCSYQTSYGWFDLLTAAPEQLALAFSTDSGVALESQEATLMVFGSP